MVTREHSGSSAGEQIWLGIDLGSVQVKGVLLREGAGGIWASALRPAQGRPLAALAQVLEELAAAVPGGGELEVQVASTGAAQELLQPWEHLVLRVNEVVAAALGTRELFPEARTAIDLGGQFSKAILLGARGAEEPTVLDFATNGLCAAGSGAFLEQQAGRLQLSVEELGRLAARAERGATIAGRCSVFAKSDMIHLQQKGTPVEEIAYGLCQAVVRSFVAMVGSIRRLKKPIVLLGGGAASPGLVRALGEALRTGAGELLVPEQPQLLGALGAARSLLPLPPAGGRLSGPLPAEPASRRPAIPLAQLAALIRQAAESEGIVSASSPAMRAGPAAPSLIAGGELATRLAPLVRAEESGPPDEDPPLPGEAEELVAWLGVDVGSVSTNLVLLGEQRQVLQGIYLPTRGRPVDALQEGLALIAGKLGARRLRVLGVGATGSGRHLAARVLGADAVHNEITAQQISATAYVPEVDTIFEIGGQDSKYISVRGGHLHDFEMNKICAAGTGSFLEEQAQRLGVPIIDGFAARAFLSGHPCDLGTRCTVFMDAELVRAQQRGASVEDLCAGLAYSVARNYLEKVVAGRPVGRCIVFQGGTASNQAVVAAFRQLLGRTVHVHPYRRISGAIGAALLAERAMLARPRPSRFLGLDACAEPSTRSFECKRCENRCQVNRITLGSRQVHFGDVCERFSEQDREQIDRPRPFPELFAEREALLEKFLTGPSPVGSSLTPPFGLGWFSEAGNGKKDKKIGVIRGSLNREYLPLWLELLRALGYEPVLSPPTSPALLQAHGGGVPAEVCLPIRAAAAQARALLAEGQVEQVFVPGLLQCPGRNGEEGADTCLYTQQLPDMLRVELGSRIVSAQFALAEGMLGLMEPVLALAEALDRSSDQVLRALTRARAVQAAFTAARTELGRRALASSFDRAVVVLGRPYNTHDPALNLALARQLDRLGLPAIPWDLLPLDDVPLEERWSTIPWHFNREQLRVLELVRRDRRLFALQISSYGCGPDGFAAKHLEELLAGRPRLLLEFDEHRGEAGLVTRLEAFADEIEEHLRHREVSAPPALRLTPGPRPLPRGRHFFIPSFPQAAIYAGALRSVGCEATVLPIPDEQTIRLGEAYSSGRECHPYSIVAGGLIQLVQQGRPDDRDVFLCPNCETSCLLRQYGDGLRLLLQRMGKSGPEVWEAAGQQMVGVLGTYGVMRFYEGLLAADLLMTLATRLRAYELQPGESDRRLAEGLERLSLALAERRSSGPVLEQEAAWLWAMPRRGRPGDRPVVGVTGDMFTRMDSSGNARLFNRLEEMGCEVWPSPYFAGSAEMSATACTPALVQRGLVFKAMTEGLTWALAAGIRRMLILRLPPELRELAAEPAADTLLQLARPYVSPRTNYLIQLSVAKTADFFQRGASGVINAAGINCMVGTATAGVLPALREGHDQAPAVTLIYGGSEGPAQRIRLETFVHQVHERWRAAQAGRLRWTGRVFRLA